MKLTRKILEGITEVEFEINPELQKQQKKPVLMYDVRELLTGLGWVTIGHHYVGKDFVETFAHEKINGVELLFTKDPGTGTAPPTFNVKGPWPEQFTMDTDLERLEKISKGWLEDVSFGPDPTPEHPGDKDVNIGDYQFELEDAGWKMGRPAEATINVDGKSRMGFSIDFTHPNTKDTLRLFYIEYGKVVRAFILSDPVGSVSIQSTIGSVTDAANGLVAQS